MQLEFKVMRTEARKGKIRFRTSFVANISETAVSTQKMIRTKNVEQNFFYKVHSKKAFVKKAQKVNEEHKNKNCGL